MEIKSSYKIGDIFYEKGDGDINYIESSQKWSVGTGYKSVSYYSYIGGTITQSDDYGLLR